VHATQQSTPDLDIQAFHVHSVHSYLDEPRSIPDSLVVIRFELSNDSINTSTRRLRYSVRLVPTTVWWRQRATWAIAAWQTFMYLKSSILHRFNRHTSSFPPPHQKSLTYSVPTLAFRQHPRGKASTNLSGKSVSQEDPSISPKVTQKKRTQ
jgi:hypothetical protein